MGKGKKARILGVFERAFLQTLLPSYLVAAIVAPSEGSGCQVFLICHL